MPGDLILAIDNGTQSVRALLFDARGVLHAAGRVALQYHQAQPGWHEHDAEEFWRSACTACLQVWDQAPALRGRVAGIVVTAQRGTIVAVDRDGHPLRPAITWLDQRTSPQIPRIAAPWRAAFTLAGVRRTVEYFQREAEANWIAACEPELARRVHRYLLLSGFLNFRLTGRYADSIGAQVGYVPFDFKRLAWASARDWKWQALRMEPSMLPELLQPGTTLGTLTPTAAAQIGVAAGTPVVAGAADKAAEVLGAGCVEPSIAALSFGTTATINVTTDRYVEAQRFIPPYPAALPHRYDVEVQIFRGYWMVSWFKEQFGQLERDAAARTGTTAEALFDALIADVPAGSMGLMLQPYWSPGLRMPHAKGAIVGFGDVHTRAHLYRAILEGLAYALREGGERIARKTRIPIRALRVCGGGSQSDAAMQITADVFGLPTERPHVYETSGLGAAIDAAVGLGFHASFADAVCAMTRVQRSFTPNPAMQARYDALYRRVYARLYDRLVPLYHAIAEIVGYPPK